MMKATPRLPTEPSEYSEEYYLTACDGHSEYMADRDVLTSQRLKALWHFLRVGSGTRILDLGCGRGELAVQCGLAGASAVGIDYSADGIRLARKAMERAESLGRERWRRPELAIGNALHLPFQDNTFDRAVMSDVVEHLHPGELMAALEEVHRVLAPEGELLIHTMPNLWYYRVGYPIFRFVQRLQGKRLPIDPRERFSYSHLHINEQTPLTLRKALADSPFSSWHVWLYDYRAYSAYSRVMRNSMKLLTSLPLIKWAFCDDIFAVARVDSAQATPNRDALMCRKSRWQRTRRFCWPSHETQDRQGRLKACSSYLAESHTQDVGVSIGGLLTVQNDSFEYDGERLVPHDPRLRSLLIRDLAAFRFASQFCAGGSVLDAGCGAGLGSSYLASGSARYCTGVDISSEAVNYAHRTYARREGRQNLAYGQMNVLQLAFPDHTFDMITSIEVIEHLADPERYVAEIRRVLKDEGTLIMSTPNKRISSPTPGSLWPHHVKEYHPEELRTLLGRHFSQVELWGLSIPVYERHPVRRIVHWLAPIFKPILPIRIRTRFLPSLQNRIKSDLTLDDVLISRERVEKQPTVLAVCRV